MDTIKLDTDWNSLNPKVPTARIAASYVKLSAPVQVEFPDHTIKGVESANFYIVKYQDGDFEILCAEDFERLFV